MRLLFDGLENESLDHLTSSHCPVCGAVIRFRIRDYIEASPAKITPKHIEQSNFDYDRVFQCKNKHQNFYRIKYEEKQPARYTATLIHHQVVKTSEIRALLDTTLVLVLLSILPVAVTFANVSLFLQHQRRNGLTQYGQRTNATVRSMYSDPGGVKRAAVYELTYDFTVDDLLITDTKKVDATTYNLAAVGSAIEIYYDQRNPYISDVSYNDSLFMETFSVIVIDVSVIGGVAYIYISTRNTAKSAK